MKRKISDLAGWPVGVWVGTGQYLAPKNPPSAQVESASARGRNVRLVVVESRRQYSTTLSAESKAAASAAAQALMSCRPITVADAGAVEFSY